MATLFAGDEAAQRIAALCGEGHYLTLTGHPEPQSRGDALQLLALAQPHRAIVVDVMRTPQLRQTLQEQPLVGALCGKTMGHALMATLGWLPDRIACAQTAHALILGDVPQPMGLDALIALYCEPKQMAQPHADASAMAQFGLVAQRTATLLRTLTLVLQSNQLQQVSRIEAAVTAPLVAMERHGFPISAARLKACIQQDAASLLELGNICSQAIAGTLVASMSDKELLDALAEKGLALTSLSESSIMAALPFKVAKNLAQFIAKRRLQAMMGERFLQHISDRGRIHSHFVQIGARSGRMACTRPNLQAIPTDAARRACFVAPQGSVFVMGDYAACELRILGELSGDRALIEALQTGRDLHAAIATAMFGQTVSKTIRPELRHAAKTIAFGLLYGMGELGLAQRMQISTTEARHLTEKFFAAFVQVRGYLEEQSAQALKDGHIRTLSARLCKLPDAPNKAGPSQASLLRLARNLPIQGSSADIIKVAIARVYRALKDAPHRQLLHCIHDEIVILCPIDEADDVGQLLKDAMEGAALGLMRRVGLQSDVRIQQEWQAH